MNKTFYVYLLTNHIHSTFYVGITNSLTRRLYQHKHKVHKNSFTARYNIYKLIYFEIFDVATNAIKREKEIKGWRREKKLNLAKKGNPELVDLQEKIDWF